MFESAAPGLHEYVAIGSIDGESFLPGKVAHAQNAKAAKALVGSRTNWDGILVHGLRFVTMRPLMDDILPSVAIAWYVWGHEAYEWWPALKEQLYLPRTRATAARLSGPPGTWNMRRLVRRLCNDDLREVRARYSYCVTQLREEYDLFVTSGLISPTTEFQWGSVGQLDDYTVMQASPRFGPDIQLGNSATCTNNHQDAFEMLTRLDLGSRRVIVPLSYGDERYRQIVIRDGRRLLGDHFTPLESFMPLDQYLSSVSTCGHVIMNHCRQQALGGIIDALWRGARVYLNDTPVYRTLLRLGFQIGLCSKTIGSGSLLEPLTAEAVLEHRRLLLEHVGGTRVAMDTVRLLDEMRSHSAGRLGSVAE